MSKIIREGSVTISVEGKPTLTFSVGDRIRGMTFRGDANVDLPYTGTITGFTKTKTGETEGLRVSLDDMQVSGYIRRFVNKKDKELLVWNTDMWRTRKLLPRSHQVKRALHRALFPFKGRTPTDTARPFDT